MNSVQLIGNITKDLKLKTAASGKEYLHFSVAVKRKRGEGTDFLDCTAFGQTAKTLSSYCQKGSKIGINGRIQIDKKEIKGETRYLTSIIVEEITFTDSKKTSSKTVQQDEPNIFDEVMREMASTEKKPAFKTDDSNPFKTPNEDDPFDFFGLNDDHIEIGD